MSACQNLDTPEPEWDKWRVKCDKKITVLHVLCLYANVFPYAGRLFLKHLRIKKQNSSLEKIQYMLLSEVHPSVVSEIHSAL